MAEENLEAIEAQADELSDETAHYECAFHILPTIADEEVPSVIDGLKSLITHAGGTIVGEEVSERYDLAYEITKQIDGANRRFNAAHFGWIRFTLPPAALPLYMAEMKQKQEMLRYLVIRLTREEEENPFSIFETRRAAEEVHTGRGKKNEDPEEAGGEVSEEALDQSLEKITAE